VSKLIVILVVRQLAQQVAKNSTTSQIPIIINSPNPGLCKTELTRHLGGVLGLTIGAVTSVVGRTSEMGSRTLWAAACASEESSGSYMDNCRVCDPSLNALGDEASLLQKRVYDELMEILSDIEPGIMENIQIQ
jgi:retinol dehydrogenase 12